MPWSKAQHRLFAARAHGWVPPAASGIDISQQDAARMASEGVKPAGATNPRDRGMDKEISRAKEKAAIRRRLKKHHKR